MFGNLRKKLSNVIQESKENLSRKSHSDFEVTKAELGIPNNININAGCSFLQKNEEIWQDMHEANEINAEKAKIIGSTILRITDRTNNLNVDISDLKVCIVRIPLISEVLKNCIENIKTISEECQTIEDKLVQLEDIIEEIELQERMNNHKIQMSMYKQKKIAQLEEFRQKLAAKHEDNIKKYEKDLRKVQQERQAVFQDAFQQDLEVFKEKGSIPKVEHIQASTRVPELTLEEIDLGLDDNENKTALESFLND